MRFSLNLLGSAICDRCTVRTVGLCGLIDDSARGQLIANRHSVSYPANTTLWGEGEVSEFIGIVTQGYLRLERYGVDGRRQIASILMPGDVVGDTLGRPSTFAVAAATKATVCRFDARVFQQQERTDPAFRRAVYRQRMMKVEQLRGLSWVLGALNAEERLCAFLSMATQYMPYTPLPEGGGLLTVELPRADIADLLGITVETISRVTRRLEAEGIIRIRTAQSFEIPDLGRLVRIGCYETTIGLIDTPATMGHAQAAPEGRALSRPEAATA